MIASNIICRGASRFLNTAYFQDVSISGTATLSSLSLSGNLSVTGTSTLSGHVSVGGYNNTSYGLSANSAIINNWIRTVGSTGWYNESHGGGWWMKDNDYIRSYNKPVLMDHNMYFGTAGDSGYYVKTTGAAKFASVAAPAAAINNATISGDLTVNGVLHSNEFIKNIVKAVGGQLYVSPTFQATSSTTISCTSADTSYVYLTLQDNGITSSEYAGATWYSESKIMLSGTLTANTTGHTEEILFSSAPGELTAQMNGGTNGAKKLQIKVEYDNASTYFKAGNLTFSDVAVMMYQLKNGSNYFPIGIYIKAYGTDNQKSYIDIFGGSDTTPNARLGLLTGLGSMPSGSTIQGWGIYTDNGFFKGIVEANGGLIGNWTIGTTGMYYNSDAPSSTSITMIPGGTTASTTSIGGSSGSKSWIFTGKNLFGIDTTGKLYASSAEISGKITAQSGTIGGFHITSSTNQGTSSAGGHIYTNSLYRHSGDGTTYEYEVGIKGDAAENPSSSSTAYGNLAFYVKRINKGAAWNGTKTDMFYVSHNGFMYCRNADIAGKITATSGAIAGWRIESTYLASGTATAPAANTLLLSPAGTTSSYTIAGTEKSGWMITAGTTFGVNKDGGVYASSGKIGPWNVTTTSIYKGENVLGSTTSGAAYFGDLGLSVGSKFKVDASGVATLGDPSGYHSTMDADSFDVLNGSTTLATFGEVTRINGGSSDGSSVLIDAGGFSFTNIDGDEMMKISTDNVTIGKNGSSYFYVDSNSIVLRRDNNNQDVFKVESGGGDTETIGYIDHHYSKFTSTQISNGVTITRYDSGTKSSASKVRVIFYKKYTYTTLIDGQSVTKEEYKVNHTLILNTSYYTTSFTENSKVQVKLSSGNSGGVKYINDKVSYYCDSSKPRFEIIIYYTHKTETYSNLNMNGNMAVTGSIAATGSITANNITCTGISAPLFIEKYFKTGSLSVGANTALQINFTQLSGYETLNNYKAIAFSHISVNNNFLYFRWMNSNLLNNDAIAVVKNSSAAAQSFVLEVRIIFALTTLFGNWEDAI